MADGNRLVLTLADAEALTLQFRLSDYEALTLRLVELAKLGMDRELVVPWRVTWTGSPKPLSHTWAHAVGMFGGTATDQRIAHQILRPVERVRSARNARLLSSAPANRLAEGRFELALKVYQDTLTRRPTSVARLHGVMRQEAALYYRRLARAVADLGYSSLEAALRDGRHDLRQLFYSTFDLTPAALKAPWTESPERMWWTLPQPTWCPT